MLPYNLLSSRVLHTGLGGQGAVMHVILSRKQCCPEGHEWPYIVWKWGVEGRIEIILMIMITTMMAAATMMLMMTMTMMNMMLMMRTMN